jgi:hypothetical protein
MSLPPAETDLPRHREGTPMAGFIDTLANDPILVGLIVVMLLFVFFAYLFVRRTLTGLREGYESGYKK